VTFEFKHSIIHPCGTEVHVVEDSIGPHGIRATTLQLRYHRFVHAELLTHRALSRNSSSSRAIPIHAFIEQVSDDPALPIFVGRVDKGMKTVEEVADPLWVTERLAELGRHVAEKIGYIYAQSKAAKEILNRYLEPWQWMHTVITCTDWEWLFEPRLEVDEDGNPEAQREMYLLVSMIKEALEKTTPRQLAYGEWHLPYVTPEDRKTRQIPNLLVISTARCCRVSYARHGQVKEFSEDLRRHNDLVFKKHWSPTEHPLMCVSKTVRGGNVRGYLQYRQMVGG